MFASSSSDKVFFRVEDVADAFGDLQCCEEQVSTQFLKITGQNLCYKCCCFKKNVLIKEFQNCSDCLICPGCPHRSQWVTKAIGGNYLDVKHVGPVLNKVLSITFVIVNKVIRRYRRGHFWSSLTISYICCLVKSG